MRTYGEMMYEDVKEWLYSEMPNDFLDGLSLTESIDKVYDELGDTDITGNLTGSYYCNSYRAREMVMEYIDDVARAYMNLGMESEFCEDVYTQRWEKMDVIARIDVLYQAVSDAVTDFYDDDERE